MEGAKLVPHWWRIAAMLLACVCVALTVALAARPGDTAAESAVATSGDTSLSLVEDPLSLWTDDAPLKKELVEYVEAVTDEKGPDYIAPEERVATFDFDGTLFSETDPIYFDCVLFLYRVLEDPTYKDKASDFEREVAAKIVAQVEDGIPYNNLGAEHGRALASAFKGMGVDGFYDYVHEVLKQPMRSYTGMSRGDSFFQPMVQVVEYLEANDFEVYIVSGTDRLIMRGVFSADTCPIDLPLDHVLGSDSYLVGSKQGDADGYGYTLGQDEGLVVGGTFLLKSLRENKCYIVERELARRPVLSFGNSSGDYALDNYALGNPDHRSLAFQVLCDDMARENGDEELAQSRLEDSQTYGYVPISMKNDWKTIFGDGVTYIGAKDAYTADVA